LASLAGVNPDDLQHAAERTGVLPPSGASTDPANVFAEPSASTLRTDPANHVRACLRLAKRSHLILCAARIFETRRGSKSMPAGDHRWVVDVLLSLLRMLSNIHASAAQSVYCHSSLHSSLCEPDHPLER
jgi:hypothetical protein